MYSNAAAVSRPEISECLEEAPDIEKLLIANRVLPIRGLGKRAGRYPKLKIAEAELLKSGGGIATKRSPSGTYNRSDRKWDWDTYDCVEYGLEETVDDSLREEMTDFFDMEVVTGRLVTRQLMIDYEKRVADLVMSPANSGFTATPAAIAYTEANLATIDFAKDIVDAKERLEGKGVFANKLVLSRALFNRARRSAKLQTYIYGNIPGAGNKDITAKALAEAFELDEVLVCGAKLDIAQKGKAYNLSSIWGTDYMLLASVKGGDFKEGGIGRTIVWDADVEGGMWATETYREEQRRSDVVRVRTHCSEKIVDPTSGELITTNWA